MPRQGKHVTSAKRAKSDVNQIWISLGFVAVSEKGATFFAADFLERTFLFLNRICSSILRRE